MDLPDLGHYNSHRPNDNDNAQFMPRAPPLNQLDFIASMRINPMTLRGFAKILNAVLHFSYSPAVKAETIFLEPSGHTSCWLNRASVETGAVSQSL